LVLVLSEIIPKSLGAKHWIRLAPFMPAILNGMILILKPFIIFSDWIMRRMGGSAPESDIRAEIKALTTLGRENDTLDEDERRVIANILDLHEVKLGKIMTPRTVCEYVCGGTTAGQNRTMLRDTAFSRYPVLDETEHPQGVVFRSEMLDADPETKVEDLLKPVKIFTDDLSTEDALSTLLKEHQHLVLIYDEYGTWLGLVTMEDILETILGTPIIDETDDIPNMRRHARRRWEHRLKNL
jgi:CBS domain containing-hemolysin-like protein